MRGAPFKGTGDKPYSGFRTRNYEWMEDFFVNVAANVILAFLMPVLFIDALTCRLLDPHKGALSEPR